jgi:N-sulfoglucosamine sulfohydrolase
MKYVKLIAWLVVASSWMNAIAVAEPAKRPNILFCFADDWGRYAGAYSQLDGRPSPSDVVKTPTLDRIAREGVTFRNAFVNAPSCTPCRSALLSGQYFFRTGMGAILLGAKWDETIPSFPLLLQAAGYHIGKSHKVWSPGAPVDAPYGGQKHAYESAGGGITNFSEQATAVVAKGGTVDEHRRAALAQVRGNFTAFLADRKDGTPWCYWFGPTNVHRAWVKGSGKALWGIEPGDLKGKLPAFLPDVPEVREDFADYLGEIQAWDAGIGELLRQLEETGELENTYILVSGDHGAPGFTHGKCNLYDFGVGMSLFARVPGGKGGRVVDDFVNLMDLAPTFLEIGGAPVPDVMTGRSLLSVLKSEQAGLVDPARTWVVTGRERHVAAAREENLPYPQRAVRTAEFLYIRNFKPDRWPMGMPGTTDPKALGGNTFAAFADMDASPTKTWLITHGDEPQYKKFYDFAFAKRPLEELYDLKKDPDQVTNVAADPAYASQKQELADRLLKTLADANDPRVVGDGTMFDDPPYSSPADRPAKANAGRKKRAATN